jgi:hypothetical protein
VSGLNREEDENGDIWHDNAYSIEHRFQSLVSNLANRGEEPNSIDRLTALVCS